jgi:chromatin remodeling complex protein RSC6
MAAKKPAKKAAKKGAKKAVKKVVAKKAAPTKAAKKVAPKKVAKKAAKKAAKKVAKKVARKPNAAFMAALKPSALLAAIVGDKPLSRPEVTKKVWAYIKKNGLQDSVNRRNINADAKLGPIFGGKKQVSMFDLTKLVSQQLSA